MSFYTNELDLQHAHAVASIVPQEQQLPIPSTAQSSSPSSSGWENITNVSSASPAPSNGSLDPASSSSGKNDFENVAFYHQFTDVERAISNFTKHQPFNHHYAPNVHMNRNNRHNNNYNNNGNNNGNNRYQNNHNYNNNNYHQNNHHNNNMMGGNNQFKQYNNMGRNKHQQNGNNKSMMMQQQQQVQYNQQQQHHQLHQQIPSRQQTPQQMNFPQYAQVQAVQVQQYQQSSSPQAHGGLTFDNIYGSPSQSNNNTPAHQLNQNLMNSLRSSNSPSGFGATAGVAFGSPLEQQINTNNTPGSSAGGNNNFGLSNSDILSSTTTPVNVVSNDNVATAATSATNGFYRPDIWSTGVSGSGSGGGVWA